MSNLRNSILWSSVILAYLLLLALGMLDSLRSPFFLDISSELNLSDSVAALLFVATSIIAFVTGLTVPRLLKITGLLNAVRLGLLLMGLGYFFIAKSYSLFWILIAASVFGVGFGIINVVQNLLVLEGSTPTTRRRLLNGLHGMYALAALIAPALAILYFRAGFTWRTAFELTSSIVIIGFIFSFFVHSKSEDKSSHNGNINPSTQSKNSIPELKKIEEPNLNTNLSTNSRAKEQYINILFGIMLSLYIISEVLISTRLPLYLRREYLFSPEASAGILAIFFLLLFLGRFVFMILKISLSSLKVIELSLISSLAFYLAGLYLHPYCFVVCGLTMAPIFGTAVDFVSARFWRFSQEAVSICVTLSGIFLVIMHYTIGFLTERYGIRLALHFGIITLVIAIMILITMRNSFSEQTK